MLLKIHQYFCIGLSLGVISWGYCMEIFSETWCDWLWTKR